MALRLHVALPVSHAHAQDPGVITRVSDYFRSGERDLNLLRRLRRCILPISAREPPSDATVEALVSNILVALASGPSGSTF